MAPVPPLPQMPRLRCNAAGRSIIKRWEDFRPKAYLCPAGVWTIGYGHTKGVSEGMTVTEAEAEWLLDLDIDEAEEAVARICPHARGNQFSALVSFTFNLGEDKLRTSRLAKYVNAKDPRVAAEFGRWVYAGGRKLQGLVQRRKAEAWLFEKEDES